MPYIRLNGTDITRYIEEIKWSDNDLDGPEAGRTLDTIMHRYKLGSKHRADIKLIPVTSAVAYPILSILKNQYFTCETDLIPDYPNGLSMEMYNSTRSGSVAIVTTDGKIKHKDISFNIIER